MPVYHSSVGRSSLANRWITASTTSQNFTHPYVPICRELTRIFKSEGKSLESTSRLRKLIAERSGLGYMADGSQQDLMQFHDLLLRFLYDELTIKNDHDGLRKLVNFTAWKRMKRSFFTPRMGNVVKDIVQEQKRRASKSWSWQYLKRTKNYH